MPFCQGTSFLFILAGFCLMGCFWKELEGHTTGRILVVLLSSSALSSEPGPPSSSDCQLPLPPSSSSVANPPSPPSPPSSPSQGSPPSHASPPSPPSDSYQPPGTPSSPSDGQLPSPPSSSSGANPPSPPSGSLHPPESPSSPSSSPGASPPSPPSGGLHPPESPSSPSSSPGASPPSPPSGGLQPPGSPCSPSSSPGASPPSPPSGGLHPPGSPSSPSSSPGASPPSPPSPPSPGCVPSPPSLPPSPALPPSPVFPPSPVLPPSPPSSGGDSGGSQSVSTATTDFTTVPSPTGPDLNSFLLGTLRPKCSSRAIHTDDLIGPQWDEEIRLLAERCEYNEKVTLFSCKNRCGVEERDAYAPTKPKYLPRCYCDKLCDNFGDCCFDFDALCRAHVNPQKNPLTSDQICLAVNNGIGTTYNGYIAWKTCPQNWTKESVRQKCQEEDQSDLLRNLPVFDFDSLTTYRNIFCARCNGAIDTAYWTLQLDCDWFNVTDFNFTSGRDFLSNYNCSIEKSPRDYLLTFLQRCVPQFQDCYSISQEKNEPYCQTECLRYAFPVCFDIGGIQFRNPQCGLCNGFDPSDLQCDCFSGGNPGNRPLSILFDFASTSVSVEVKDQQESETHYVEQFWSCSYDEVYDPYTGSCKPIASPGRDDHRRILNCSFIEFNKTDYIQLANGSVYLKPHNKTYGNTTYTIHDSRLLLCVNFSRNFTRTERERGNGYMRKKTPASLQLFTLIGCIVSIISLILLIITYILFAELRNLPGKIIINLTLSLLLYQSVFFSAVKNDDQDVCLAIAVLLHFFLLSSFTWMNVMAYDVHRIFTPSDVVAVNRQGNYKKRLVKYCLYGWGAPAFVVLLCVTVDHVKKGSIGYGQGADECFISQPRALLFSFVLPVALLMIFNLFALGHIVIHIVKTRKETQQVTNQRQGSNVAVISVKMASVMGVTWILGIAANLKALSFLWYPFVVLNSLQGLFIFLSFAVSGRALELYKSKVADILKNLTTKRENNTQSSPNCTTQSTNSTSTSNQHTRQSEDTSL